MDLLFKFLLAILLVSIPGQAKPALTEEPNIQNEEAYKDLLKKAEEIEDVPPKYLSKELSFIHEYNDTQVEGQEGQEASSKFTLSGGLENKIQNLGGIQKTILNNKIQYNFYFWLLPKNFSRSAWEKH